MSGEQRLGKYLVQALIAKGPGGAVYRALDENTARTVAIKTLARNAVDAALVPGLRKQVHELSLFSHPGVAHVHELLETESLLCIVMELVAGKPLSMLIKESGPFGFTQAWQVIRQLLDVLGYSHGRGVVHGGLKPADLMLDAEGRLKVVDFAVGWLASSRRARSGEIYGALHYMAPEQLRGETSTGLSDLYQAGVIIYRLLTGHLPFTGNQEEVVHRVLHERPSDPSSYNPAISWQLDWTIQKALLKDPSERFPSAREFAESLAKGLEESGAAGLEAPVRKPEPGADVAKAGPKPAVPKVEPEAPVVKVEPKAPLPKVEPKPNVLENARRIAAAKEPAARREPGTVTTLESPDPGKRPRVLFVDDEERILNGLRALFRDQYHVFTAENGEAALEIIRRFKVHVVVSDQRMPGMTGVELLRKAKEIAPATVRILLTGYSDLAAMVGSINEGEVFRFVKKPWDNDELVRTLAEACAISAELATAKVPRAATLKLLATVLVVDPGRGLAMGLERMLRAKAPVVRVPSAVEAVKALESDEVAVIVADLAVGKDGLVTMFKLLKSERPEILSILVTGEPDSELVMELINRAQIYRFLGKPVKARELYAHVETGLRKYATFKRSPALLRQHQVDPAAADSPLADRIRALPHRLGAGK